MDGGTGISAAKATICNMIQLLINTQHTNIHQINSIKKLILTGFGYINCDGIGCGKYKSQRECESYRMDIHNAALGQACDYIDGDCVVKVINKCSNYSKEECIDSKDGHGRGCVLDKNNKCVASNLRSGWKQACKKRKGAAYGTCYETTTYLPGFLGQSGTHGKGYTNVVTDELGDEYCCKPHTEIAW